MSRYPAWSGSTEFTVENLQAMIDDVYVKGNTTDRTNNTLADDPDLQGIPLGIGTWWVRLMAFWTANTSTTPKLRTRWTFTGTWNNPIRCCIGPGSANTAVRTDVTAVNFHGQSAGSDQVYNVSASTGFTVLTEESYNVVVTVAGNLALNWAQQTTNAGIISVKAGSAFCVKQIA